MYGTKSKQSKEEKGCWGGPSSKQMLLTLWAGSVTLQALWRKKRLEQKLAQTHGTLSILEVQPVAIENATTKAEVLCTMDLAAQGMKKVCQEVRGWGRNIRAPGTGKGGLGQYFELIFRIGRGICP